MQLSSRNFTHAIGTEPTGQLPQPTSTLVAIAKMEANKTPCQHAMAAHGVHQCCFVLLWNSRALCWRIFNVVCVILLPEPDVRLVKVNLGIWADHMQRSKMTCHPAFQVHRAVQATYAHHIFEWPKRMCNCPMERALSLGAELHGPRQHKQQAEVLQYTKCCLRFERDTKAVQHMQIRLASKTPHTHTHTHSRTHPHTHTHTHRHRHRHKHKHTQTHTKQHTHTQANYMFAIVGIGERKSSNTVSTRAIIWKPKQIHEHTPK